VLALLAVGCGGHEPTAPPPPAVTVARPIVEEIVDWDEYTGRLQATESVEVRPRVSGYVESIHFADGATVKTGDLLFVIDPRPYVAALDRARAEAQLSEARLALARKELGRAQKLLKSDTISQELTDTRATAAQEGEASLAAAKAAVAAAELDVEFTRVIAPIAGRTGRHLVDEGNLVTAGSTVLTTIVSLDPIHVYFDADERAYLKYSRLAKAGARPSSREVNNPVRIGLADEDDFPHEGWMDFVDNQLDTGTGTIVGRALVPNPDLLLSPGLFVRLRLLGSAPYRAVLVPDEAIGTDQAQKFVWVVDAENRAQYRRVTIGTLRGTLRVVRDGLGPDDRVVVAGLQRVRPGIVVAPEERPAGPQRTARDVAPAAAAD
jgi:RND family efflux transporter MFP subunit